MLEFMVHKQFVFLTLSIIKGTLDVLHKIVRQDHSYAPLNYATANVSHAPSQPHLRISDNYNSLEERLPGASLLIFANKQGMQGLLSPDEIAKVSDLCLFEV